MDTIENNDDEQVVIKSATNGTDLTKSYLWGRYEILCFCLFFAEKWIRKIQKMKENKIISLQKVDHHMHNGNPMYSKPMK